MTQSTPAIHITNHSNRRPLDRNSSYRSSSTLIATLAEPMAIPHAREAVPPPLPPPQFIPEISSGSDPGWQWANDPAAFDYGRAASVKPGSSLLGGLYRPSSQERNASEHVRRTSSTSTITPPSRDVEMEDKPDDDVPRIEHSFRGERKLERSTWQDASQAYDKQLVSRIGGPNTPSKTLSGSNIQDVSERERRNSLLPALGQSHESTRWLPSMSPSGTIAGTWEASSHTRHSSIQSERYDQQQEDFPMDDANREDVFANFRSGAKRRASSPPRDLPDRSPISGVQRLTEIRAPTTISPRYHPNHASLSSVSSFGGQRHGSLSSSLGVASVPSSATSYASGVLSPLAASTKLDKEPTNGMSEVTSAVSTHSRTTTAEFDNRLGHSRESSRTQSGVYICECCPKKPRKFETADELKAHEAEKQYGCLYCSNRFKNKNEAERHQNSLHLRRHSWSCAALAGHEAAYHPSPTSAEHDVCGYCGDEFINPADWTDRIQHLTTIHKFGQCNQTKKFFRADHFRQHLKHSHDSTSGKWTNMLENACMKDEPPPIPVTVASSSDSTSFTAASSDFPAQRP